jgi:hypothetical protein
MFLHEASLGTRVVRSKGDYVVGRTGTIIDLDVEKKRARVSWDGDKRTWVKTDVIEAESTPYKIDIISTKTKTGFSVKRAQYIRL